MIKKLPESFFACISSNCFNFLLIALIFLSLSIANDVSTGGGGIETTEDVFVLLEEEFIAFVETEGIGETTFSTGFVLLLLLLLFVFLLLFVTGAIPGITFVFPGGAYFAVGVEVVVVEGLELLLTFPIVTFSSLDKKFDNDPVDPGGR